MSVARSKVRAMSLELVHFATMTINLSPDVLVIPGGPLGTRVVAEVDNVSVSGDKLNATMAGKSAADWLTIGPDGSYGTLDVRLTLRTDDDAIIYVEYSGRIDLGTNRAVSAPLFQTGDERYDWLNRIQAVADGTNNPETHELVYELYEARSA